jgi:dTDP-4-amino-4,6-dideoxygalactose transaminase
VRAGATPVLADIDPNTALLSPHSAGCCITNRSRAIVPVHLYGQLRDMSLWQRLCAEHDIALIEDCAQAHRAQVDGRFAGSFGRAGAYSFYPTKNLGAIGDAGALVTNDAEVAARAGRIRNYGQSVRYHHPDLGLNSRLDEIQAAMLSARLACLDSSTQRRQEIAASYFAEIDNSALRLLSPPESFGAHVYHLFVICCAERDALRAHLSRAGVQTLIHYPVPIHHQEPFRAVQRDSEGLTNSERHARECVSIPCHPHMSTDDVRTVLEALNSFEAN